MKLEEGKIYYNLKNEPDYKPDTESRFLYFICCLISVIFTLSIVAFVGYLVYLISKNDSEYKVINHN